MEAMKKSYKMQIPVKKIQLILKLLPVRAQGELQNPINPLFQLLKVQLPVILPYKVIKVMILMIINRTTVIKGIKN
jgi:hypothetical protein